MDTLSLTKEAKICNGLKTISLTSGAGKSGHIPGTTLPAKVNPLSSAWLYNGLKTTSLTSGAGKTCQPLVKE